MTSHLRAVGAPTVSETRMDAKSKPDWKLAEDLREDSATHEALEHWIVSVSNGMSRSAANAELIHRLNWLADFHETNPDEGERDE